MSCAEHPLHRSYLYAPGSSARVLRKALVAGPDAVVFDLEDAVAADAKAGARHEIVRALGEVAAGDSFLGPDVHVRINRDGDSYDVADIDAAVRPGLDALRLPKVESAAMVAEVADHVGTLESERGLPPGSVGLYLVVESALGAVRLAALATADPRVQRMVIGKQDLLADLGAEGDDGLATLHVCSEIVLHSRAAGIGPPIDGVFPSLNDEIGLRQSSLRARHLGFFGRSVLHPQQLAIVHEVFTPTNEELAHAQRLVAALEVAEKTGSGSLQLDGEFVDRAVAKRAQSLLARREKS